MLQPASKALQLSTIDLCVAIKFFHSLHDFLHELHEAFNNIEQFAKKINPKVVYKNDFKKMTPIIQSNTI